MTSEVIKMNDTRHDITSVQLMAFIIASQIGIGILVLPSLLARQIGHDGWISTIITGVVCLIVVVIIMLLLRRYINKTIFEINISLYGKILGYILNLFFIIYLLFITGITLRVFVEVINIIILKFTPALVITGLLLIPTIYATSKGLKVICRFVVLLFFAYLILILSLSLVVHHIRYTYIMPIGKSGLIPIINSIKSSFYSFLGFELVTLIYPNIKNKEKAFKYMIMGIIFTTMYFTVVAAITTMLFGEIKLSMLVFPIYSMEQIITVPVIERLDTVYILFWFPTMAATVLCYFFSTYYSVSKLIKIKRGKLLIAIVTIIEIIISRIPKNFEATSRYSNYSGIYGMLIIGSIIITFFITLFKKKEAGVN
jgi:spore germination protein (amino acid permease)